MSVRIMTAVWALHLSDSEKLVLLALADCANDEGLCWPSMATLAAKCSKSDRTVQAAIKSLCAGGHMTRDERPGRGCRYIIHPTPEAASPPKQLHPRKDFTPEAVAPPKAATPTPEAASDKPSRTITPQEASPPSVRPRRSEQRVRPHRLPADWQPSRFSDDTVARGIVDRRGTEWTRAALESFRGWAANAADKDGQGRKVDWQAAWGNWIITEDNRHGRQRAYRPDPVAGGDGLGPTARSAMRVVNRNRGAPQPAQPSASDRHGGDAEPRRLPSAGGW